MRTHTHANAIDLIKLNFILLPFLIQLALHFIQRERESFAMCRKMTASGWRLMFALFYFYPSLALSFFGTTAKLFILKTRAWFLNQIHFVPV